MTNKIGKHSTRQEVLSAVRKNGNALREASGKFKSDRGIVHAAVTNNGNALVYADKKFFEDKELVKMALDGGFKSKSYRPRQTVDLIGKGKVAEELLSDFDIALAAVKKNYDHYFKLSEEFKKNKDVVKEAVRQNWKVFKRVDVQFKGDKEVASIALRSSIHAFKYMLPSLRTDKKFLREELNKNPELFGVLGLHTKDDENLVRWFLFSEEIKSDRRYKMLQSVPDRFKKDIIFIKELLNHNHNFYPYVEENFKNDYKLALLYLENNNNKVLPSTYYLGDELRNRFSGVSQEEVVKQLGAEIGMGRIKKVVGGLVAKPEQCQQQKKSKKI